MADTAGPYHALIDCYGRHRQDAINKVYIQEMQQGSFTTTINPHAASTVAHWEVRLLRTTLPLIAIDLVTIWQKTSVKIAFIWQIRHIFLQDTYFSPPNFFIIRSQYFDAKKKDNQSTHCAICDLQIKHLSEHCKIDSYSFNRAYATFTVIGRPVPLVVDCIRMSSVSIRCKLIRVILGQFYYRWLNSIMLTKYNIY